MRCHSCAHRVHLHIHRIFQKPSPRVESAKTTLCSIPKVRVRYFVSAGCMWSADSCGVPTLCLLARALVAHLLAAFLGSIAFEGSSWLHPGSLHCHVHCLCDACNRTCPMQGKRNVASRLGQAIGQLARASMHMSEGEGPSLSRRPTRRKHKKADHAVSEDDVSSQASAASMTEQRDLKASRGLSGTCRRFLLELHPQAAQSLPRRRRLQMLAKGCSL